MRSTNVILAILSLSSTISALAAPRSAAFDAGLNVFEKDCQYSAMGSVCHKTSHINCCNGFSCEMMDNPNGDYGICRASNDRLTGYFRCVSSKIRINCCFGLYCDMTNNPNGDYGKCKPSHESNNPLKKIEDAERCLESGSMHCNLQGAPPCCSGAKCNKVGRSDSPMFMCEKESDDQDSDDKCLKPGSMHCNYLGSPKCCSGSKCNNIGKSDSNMFMCEKESDDDDKKQCLVPGVCKNVRGENFMCAKDSDDDDDDVSTVLSQDQQPFLSSKDKNVFEEDCDRNMCIEGGQMCHRHRQNSKCPPAPCCPDFQCAYDPTGCSPFGCKNPHPPSFSSKIDKKKVHVKKINIIAAAKVKVAQEEEHSRLYALKGMFHGFVEKIEKKYCLPQGESCMMQHDKCCHGLMCHSGECMADNDELKI
ncbi:uncharacterized protein EAF02_003085 [Botrytis sinoallii]|uniref:uncharacterized protein n=1 Tax=Botrytis sinoallii TaxID=1463999 RepID=UPI0019001315|nr:uncharacterized protein EAF02_003085 [Botrytis sinoallii]KAF7888544.1 hypothetical protein EAF02_003085 [Botrytis sinoallii]